MSFRQFACAKEKSESHDRLDENSKTDTLLNRANNGVHSMKPHKKAFQENRMQCTVTGMGRKVADQKSMPRCSIVLLRIVQSYRKMMHMKNSKAAIGLFTPPKANV